MDERVKWSEAERDLLVHYIRRWPDERGARLAKVFRLDPRVSAPVKDLSHARLAARVYAFKIKMKDHICKPAEPVPAGAIDALSKEFSDFEQLAKAVNSAKQAKSNSKSYKDKTSKSHASTGPKHSAKPKTKNQPDTPASPPEPNHEEPAQLREDGEDRDLMAQYVRRWPKQKLRALLEAILIDPRLSDSSRNKGLFSTLLKLRWVAAKLNSHPKRNLKPLPAGVVDPLSTSFSSFTVAHEALISSLPEVPKIVKHTAHSKSSRQHEDLEEEQEEEEAEEDEEEEAQAPSPGPVTDEAASLASLKSAEMEKSKEDGLASPELGRRTSSRFSHPSRAEMTRVESERVEKLSRQAQKGVTQKGEHAKKAAPFGSGSASSPTSTSTAAYKAHGNVSKTMATTSYGTEPLNVAALMAAHHRKAGGKWIQWPPADFDLVLAYLLRWPSEPLVDLSVLFKIDPRLSATAKIMSEPSIVTRFSRVRDLFTKPPAMPTLKDLNQGAMDPLSTEFETYDHALAAFNKHRRSTAKLALHEPIKPVKPSKQAPKATSVAPKVTNGSRATSSATMRSRNSSTARNSLPCEGPSYTQSYQTATANLIAQLLRPIDSMAKAPEIPARNRPSPHRAAPSSFEETDGSSPPKRPMTLEPVYEVSAMMSPFRRTRIQVAGASNPLGPSPNSNAMLVDQPAYHYATHSYMMS